METNDPGGSLADVQAARRATRVVTTPWWLRAYLTVGIAVVFGWMAADHSAPGSALSWIPIVLSFAFLWSFLTIRRSRAVPARRSWRNHTDLVELAGLVAALIVGNVLAVVFRGHDALWHYPVAILALLAIVGASQFAAHRRLAHGAESAAA